MSQRVRVRRLTDEEGRRLKKIVRRGEGKTDTSVVRWRRAMVVLASAGGNTVEAIARLVHTSPDRVREMIHRFNEMGMASLDPKWAGGRPRLITTDDEEFIVKTAKTRPEKVGRPYSRWSVRKLARYLADNPVRPVKIGRERLRQLLDRHGVTFQKTKTWKESNDPNKEAKLDRIEIGGMRTKSWGPNATRGQRPEPAVQLDDGTTLVVEHERHAGVDTHGGKVREVGARLRIEVVEPHGSLGQAVA